MRERDALETDALLQRDVRRLFLRVESIVLHFSSFVSLTGVFDVHDPNRLAVVVTARVKIATLIKMEKGLMKEQREAEEDLAIAMNQRLVKEVCASSVYLVRS